MKQILKNEIIKSAFVSGVGNMGLRHVIGLIRAGFIIDIYEINKSNFYKVINKLKELNLNSNNVSLVKKPSDIYKIAIFSETADIRSTNFLSFLGQSKAQKFLLEKPITSNPKELNLYVKTCKKFNLLDKVFVNLGQRTWKHINLIADYCKDEEEIVMTINCGAMGLGCIGIHYIDNFIYTTGEAKTNLSWSKLFKKKIKSPRGKNFQDYGANFVLENRKGTMFGSMSSQSSSHLIMSVRGKNFKSYFDYTRMRFTLLERSQNSKLPLHRYGLDYKIIKEEEILLDSLEFNTEKWANDELVLPKLKNAIPSHNLVFEILKQGGEKPPFKFT